MKLEETMEIAYPRSLVEQIILGLTDPLNQHLIKLVGFSFPTEERRHFRREVRAWLDKMQRLRIKPHSRIGSFKLYYELLFDYPFVGVELQKMRSMMAFIREEYGMEPTKSPDELVEWFREFHRKLATALHKGEAVLDLVPD